MAALTALLVLPLATTGAAAQDARALADCMIVHSTEADEDAMRQMIIAALAGEQKVYHTRLSEFTDLIVQLAIRDCGMALSDLQTEAGKQAANLYGQHMGEKIMKAALTRMGE